MEIWEGDVSEMFWQEPHDNLNHLRAAVTAKATSKQAQRELSARTGEAFVREALQQVVSQEGLISERLAWCYRRKK